MKTIDFSYFIERYNAGEMNEAEKAWFRKELEEKEKLRDEVALRQKTDMVIKDHNIIMLRNKLTAIDKKRAEAGPGKNNRKHFPLTRAAVIAGIILAGSLAFLSTRNLDNEEIFDRFNKPYDITANLRSAGALANKDYFSVAIDYYNIRDYHNAALNFSKVPGSHPKYMESAMLYGVSKFEEQNYAEAKKSFAKVIDNNKNYFVEDAHWYLALCYLKTGENEKAASELNFIKKSESIHSSNARKILRRMK